MRSFSAPACLLDLNNSNGLRRKIERDLATAHASYERFRRNLVGSIETVVCIYGRACQNLSDGSLGAQPVDGYA